MSNTILIELVIQARNAARGALSEVRGELGALDAQAGGLTGTMARVGATLTTVGGQAMAAGAVMTAGLSLPIALIGGAAIKAAADYQTAMSKVIVLAGGGTAETQKMSQSILDLAQVLPITPTALANGLYFVESAGYRGADALNMVTVAGKAAVGGLGDFPTVMDAVTSAVNAYGRDASKATEITDVMTKTVALAKVAPQDYAAALGMMLPAAAAANVSLPEIGANFATMTHEGMPAARAAMSVQRVITSLIAPTGAQTKAFEKFGLSAAGLRQELGSQGLAATLQTVWDASGRNLDILKKMIPDQRAYRDVLATVVTQHQFYTQTLEAMTGAAGTTQAAFAVAMQNFGPQLQLAENQLRVFAITIGSVLLPVLTPLLAAFNQWARQALPQLQQWLSKLSPTVILIAAGFAAFLIVIGPLVAILGGLAFAISALLTPVGLVIAAILGISTVIAAVALAWATNWGGIRDAVAPASTALHGLFAWISGTAIPAVEKFGSDLQTWIIDKFHDAQQTVSGLTGEYGRHKGTINSVATVITTIFAPALVKSGVEAVIAGGKIAASFIASVVEAGVQAGITAGVLVLDLGSAVVDLGIKMTATAIGGIADATLALVGYVAEGWAAVAMLGGLAVEQLIAMGPFLLVAAAIAALILGLYELLKHWDAVTTFMKEGWAQAWTDIESALGNAWDWIEQRAQNGVNSVIGVLNSLIGGVNTVLSLLAITNIPLIGTVSFTSNTNDLGETNLPPAMATGGVTRGPTLVGEEPGHAEFVIPTNPAYRNNALALWMQAGQQIGIPGFAEGGIIGSITSAAGAAAGAISDPVGAIQALLNAVGFGDIGPLFVDLGQGAANLLKTGILGKVKAASTTPPNTLVSGGVVDWLQQAIALTGVPLSWLHGLEVIAYHESGGDPQAINNWDANAAAGTPSEGLMQVIGPTFAAYALPGHDDIWNPVDNAAAAIEYILARYGDISNVPGIASVNSGGPYVGYGTGGVIDEPVAGVGLSSGMRYLLGESGPEAVVPLTSGGGDVLSGGLTPGMASLFGQGQAVGGAITAATSAAGIGSDWLQKVWSILNDSQAGTRPLYVTQETGGTVSTMLAAALTTPAPSTAGSDVVSGNLTPGMAALVTSSAASASAGGDVILGSGPVGGTAINPDVIDSGLTPGMTSLLAGGTSNPDIVSYDRGGLLREDIVGFGLSGRRYRLHGGETVVPADTPQGHPAGSQSIQQFHLSFDFGALGLIEKIIELVEDDFGQKLMREAM